jgi:hypothetical protein
MAGREVGVIVGGGALKEHLTKTTDAKAAIHSWVAQNSLATPSCQPAHELLDSMGFSRADQHKGVMNHLKDRLLARIDTMPQDKKLALLGAVYVYVCVCVLLCMCVMCVYMCGCVWMLVCYECVHVCVCVCVSVCRCVHRERETHAHG